MSAAALLLLQMIVEMHSAMPRPRLSIPLEAPQRALATRADPQREVAGREQAAVPKEAVTVRRAAQTSLYWLEGDPAGPDAVDAAVADAEKLGATGNAPVEAAEKEPLQGTP